MKIGLNVVTSALFMCMCRCRVCVYAWLCSKYVCKSKCAIIIVKVVSTSNQKQYSKFLQKFAFDVIANDENRVGHRTVVCVMMLSRATKWQIIIHNSLFCSCVWNISELPIADQFYVYHNIYKCRRNEHHLSE